MKFDKHNPKTVPIATKFISKVIPKKIRQTSNWGPWIWKLNKSKTYWTKVPIDKNGNPADAKSFNLTFDRARKIMKKCGAHGLGFYFSPNNNMLGIDIDDCVVNGKINSETKILISKFGSYWEFSVSGEGVHILGEGSHKLNGVDEKFVFHQSRFLTFTSDGQGKLKDIGKKVNKIFKKKTKKSKSKSSSGTADISSISRVIEGIRPDLPEPEWFDVCKAIHSKSGGTEGGFRLFNAWSAGDYCSPQHHYKDYDERECLKKWNRCDLEKEEQVGFPRLNEIQDLFPVSRKLDLSAFKTKAIDLITPDLHRRFLTLDLFPSKCGIPQAAAEIARFNKVDPDPVLSSMIVIAAAAMNKKFKLVERKGLNHNVSLGLLIGIPTGGRKSAIDSHVVWPFHNFEKQKVAEWKKNRFQIKAEEKVLKIQLKDCYKALEDDPLDTAMVKVAGELETKIAGCRSKMPKLVESDITEEKLSDSLYENNEVMFIQSDDARNVIKNITGRYDSTSENIYICGLTGDPYRRARVKNDVDIVLNNPCINMCLKVQMDLVQAFVQKKAMQESGLIARMFLKVWKGKQSDQMRMEHGEGDMDFSLLEGYNETIKRLMAYDGKRITVTLSDGARKAYVDISNYFADFVDLGGKWEGAGNVTNKVVSATVKVAMVMKAFSKPNFLVASSGGFNLPLLEITEREMMWARNIVEIMMDQSVEVTQGLVQVEEIDGAKKLLEKLVLDVKDRDVISWSFNDIRMKYSSSQREPLERYMGVLIENGVVIRQGNNYELETEDRKSDSEEE